MGRELNPQVFSNPNIQSKDINQPAGDWHVDPTPAIRIDRVAQTADQKKLENRVQQLQDAVSETAKTLSLKTERLAQKVIQLEQKTDALSQELRSKYATLSGRLTERSLVESEVQAMIERHNQVIRTFEAKLAQVQRLCESQQMQLMNASAALDDAKREIARLKRI